MNLKGVCNTCGEVVVCTRLTFAKESGIVRSKEEKSKPFVLCAPHDAKEGYKTTQIVSAADGTVKKTICNGSLRPPQEFVH